MPARERRSPSLGEICTSTRSKRTEIGCLSTLVACFGLSARLELELELSFFVDVAT
jgi:hypothetical protein